MESRAVPEGFVPHITRSPVAAPWQPIFSRRGNGTVQLGLWVREPHCNSQGLLHGGVIATLADSAMWLTCVAGRRAAGSTLTVSLNVDYLATANLGQWLLIAPRLVKSGRTLAFADALITADGEPIARATGTFRILERTARGDP